MRKPVSPKRASERARKPRVLKPAETPEASRQPSSLFKRAKVVPSVPIEQAHSVRPELVDQMNLLQALNLDLQKDKARLFNAYDKLRLHDMYVAKSDKPPHRRSVNDQKASEFKEVAYRRIEELRLDPSDMEDEEAREKKTKFLTFVVNLQIKGAVRKWKEETFGQRGADAVLRLALVEERDRLRRQFYAPAEERRRNIARQKRQQTARNRQLVLQMRSTRARAR